MIFRDYVSTISEAVMTDDEVMKVIERLIETGDPKAKEFAKGLAQYYKEHQSFHPNQVAGLQNIMKNASFQLADK